MRIAFVAQPFERMQPPVQSGSLALWIYYMARICSKRGHEVCVFGNNGGMLLARTIAEEGVRYVFPATAVDRAINNALAKMKSKNGIPEFAHTQHHWGYARAVARKVKQLRCEVVHVMNYSQFVPVLRRMAPECKISLHMQCEWLTQLQPETMRLRVAKTDLIVGCSQYITNLIASKFPEYANRCVTVPNATDAPEIQQPYKHNSKNVLFVGRLSPEKGIHDLIQAFHQVLRSEPDAKLHLVGGAGSAPLEFLVGLSDQPHVTDLKRFYTHSHSDSGKDSYLEELETRAGTELGRRIFFHGSVPHSTIESFYSDAAVLVNPSLSESFGISLVEAMVRRIPVVATRIGGMSFTVDHDATGLLVPPADPGALAIAIADILSNEPRARRMGSAGYRKVVTNFTWDRTSTLLLEHFDCVVHGEPSIAFEAAD
jgi:glycosyltransferase involved in cell wall biosynthesis